MKQSELDTELERRLRDWRPDVTGTLLFVLSASRVLLIHKKRGHGAGKINAPGGKLEAGETVAACAVRETEEETGLRVRDPRLMARLRFVERRGDQWLGYALVGERFSGTPAETAEALPQWFSLEDIPYTSMWEDDYIWLPPVLAGRRLIGDFLFDDGRLLAHRVRPARHDELTASTLRGCEAASK